MDGNSKCLTHFCFSRRLQNILYSWSIRCAWLSNLASILSIRVPIDLISASNLFTTQTRRVANAPKIAIFIPAIVATCVHSIFESFVANNIT